MWILHVCWKLFLSMPLTILEETRVQQMMAPWQGMVSFIKRILWRPVTDGFPRKATNAELRCFFVVVSLSSMLNKHWCCVDFRSFDARLKLLQCLENHLGSSFFNHTFLGYSLAHPKQKSCEIITLVIYVHNYFYINVDSYFNLVNTSVASHVCIRNKNFVTTVPVDVTLYIGLRPSTDTVPSTWLDLISFTSPCLWWFLINNLVTGGRHSKWLTNLPVAHKHYRVYWCTALSKQLSLFIIGRPMQYSHSHFNGLTTLSIIIMIANTIQTLQCWHKGASHIMGETFELISLQPN